MPDAPSPFPAFPPDPYVHPANRPIVTEFRANHGSVGGPFTGADLLLLTTLGARSGRPATSPLAYFRDGERLLVVASAGGSPRHPAWYHNLRSHPEAVIELGDRTLTVHAAATEGAERDRSSPTRPSSTATPTCARSCRTPAASPEPGSPPAAPLPKKA